MTKKLKTQPVTVDRALEHTQLNQKITFTHVNNFVTIQENYQQISLKIDINIKQLKNDGSNAIVYFDTLLANHLYYLVKMLCFTEIFHGSFDSKQQTIKLKGEPQFFELIRAAAQNYIKYFLGQIYKALNDYTYSIIFIVYKLCFCFVEKHHSTENIISLNVSLIKIAPI